MKKLFDLRFVIGAFFLVIGLLLIAYASIENTGRQLNLICGIVFSVFGIFMVGFSFGNNNDGTKG
jgi:hypothetical protein